MCPKSQIVIIHKSEHQMHQKNVNSYPFAVATTWEGERERRVDESERVSGRGYFRNSFSGKDPVIVFSGPLRVA